MVQGSRTVPFNLEGFAPSISGASNSFVVQVRATDTGGNVGVSTPTVIHLLHDTTPPVLLRTDPAEGEVKFRGLDTVRLFLSEPLATTSLVAANFEITHESGHVTRPTAFTLRDFNREVELKIPPLDQPGNYRLIIHAATVTDGAGNPLGRADIISAFSLLRYSIRWARLDAGNWFTATNWIPPRVPLSNDWVYIGPSSTNTFVQIYTRTPATPDLDRVRVRGLESECDLVLFYADLHVDEPFVANGWLYLTASKLTDTLFVPGTNSGLGYGRVISNPFVTKEGFFSVLDGVTIRGNLTLAPGNYNLMNSLTLEGHAYGRRDRNINNTAVLNATRDTVIQGPGTFHDLPLDIASAELNAPNRQGPLVTIGSDVTFRGALEMAMEGASCRLINRGQLLADEPLPFAGGSYYSRIIMNGGQTGTNEALINEGTIEVSNGYRLLVSGAANTLLVNRGNLKADTNAFLWLSVPLVAQKILCETGGVVQLANAPLMTESGQVSELSGPGRWFAINPQFQGGTIRLTHGATLEGSATFDNVIFEGELHNYDWYNSRKLDLPGYISSYGREVLVRTNLTLNGLIAFHGQSPSDGGGRLNFYGNQSRLDGQGRVDFQSSSHANQVASGFGDLSGLLTIGPNITIQGKAVTIGNTAGSYGQPPYVENQGTLLTQPDDYLNLGTYGFTNAGVIHIAGTNMVGAMFNFAQTATGRLDFEVTGTATGPVNGKLTIPGAATLDGAVALSLIAPFQAAAGDSFELLAYASAQGRFTSLQTPPAPAGLEWVAEYNPTSFRLKLRVVGSLP